MVRLDPAQRTMEPVVKLPPLTVRVKPGLPTVADEGLIEVNDGTGLPVTVKATELEVPNPVVVTVTLLDPDVAKSEVRIKAVSWVDET